MHDREYLFDYRFRRLRRQAAGARGPYEMGVRSVVRQLEATGQYRPDPLLPYLLALHALPQLVGGTDESAALGEARAFLAAAGWTAEEGYDYARGARHAECELARYRAAPSDDARTAA